MALDVTLGRNRDTDQVGIIEGKIVEKPYAECKQEGKQKDCQVPAIDVQAFKQPAVHVPEHQRSPPGKVLLLLL